MKCYLNEMEIFLFPPLCYKVLGTDILIVGLVLRLINYMFLNESFY